MIQYIPIGDFLPDAPRLGSEAIEHSENLVPSFGGMRSVRKKETRVVNPAPDSDGGINGAMALSYLETTSEQKSRPNGVDGTPDFFRSNNEYTQDDLAELVDGVTASDTEFVVAGGGEDGEIEFTMQELDTPSSTSGWVVRIRYRIDDHGSGTHSITYTLLDGSTTLRGPETVVSSTDADSGGWVTFEDSFTGNLSWDLDDLRVLIESSVDGSDIDSVPEADADNSGLWRDESGNTTGLYESVDDPAGDDSEFIYSPLIKSLGSQPEYTARIEDIPNMLAYYENGHSPAPFLPRYRGRVNHDNVVVTYKTKLSDGTIVREDDLDFTNSASFSNETRSVNVSLITDFENVEMVVGAKLAAEWKNAEGTTGSAEPDLMKNFFPTYDSSTGTPLFSGDFSDVDDVSTDSDYLEMANTNPIVAAGSKITLGFGDFEYSGIDYGSSLNIRWRKEVSAVNAPQVTVRLTDGTTTFWSDSFTLTSTSYGNEVVNFNTTAIMAAVVAAGTNLQIEIEPLNPTSDAYFRISGIWIEHPEPARAYISRLYVETNTNARASVSWIEMEVPSSSSGYIDDQVYVYAGDKTDLYVVDPTDGFTDVSGTTYAGGSAAARPWDFEVWGNDMIATNFVDPVQIRTDNSGNFADLITSTNQPKARFVASVRNQVFLGHCQDDGGEADMVWWSALDDAADFDPDVTTQSDFQRLRDTPGQITGLVGGQYATIFKRHSIYRADYVGGISIYEFTLVSNGVGTPFPRSIVQVEEDIYFHNGSGFSVLRGGTSVQSIGDEAISRFLSDQDFSPFALRTVEESEDVFEDLGIFGAYDPNSKLIFWFYSGANAFTFEDDTDPAGIRSLVYNDAVVYDTRTGKWGYMDLLRGASQEDPVANVTAAINLFRPDPSHTSWTKGLAMFGWDNGTDHGESSGMAQTYFQFDSQDVYPSVVQTKVFTIEDGKDTQIRRVRPIFTAIPENAASPPVTVKVTSSQDPLLTIDVTETTFDSQDSDGWYTGRANGEFFVLELEFNPSNDEFIQEIQGFQVDFEVEGERG